MIKMPLNRGAATGPVNYPQMIDERFARVEVDLEHIKGRAETYRANAIVGSDRMERDVQKLQASHEVLVNKIDDSFRRIETMIATDREKASAMSGAFALARWGVGAMVGLASAFVAYWISHSHK